MAALFEPDELRGVQDLILLAERMVRPVLSSSGFGASNALRNLGSSVLDAVGGNTILELALHLFGVSVGPLLLNYLECHIRYFI